MKAKKAVMSTQYLAEVLAAKFYDYFVATVFLVRETLAFKKFYIAIINSHSNSLCLVCIK